MRKKICFVFTSPVILDFFMHEYLSIIHRDYDIYVVTNVSDIESVLKRHPSIKHIENIRIERKISIVNDCIALLKTTLFFYKNKFDIIQTITPKGGFIGQIAASVVGAKNRVHIFTGQVWANYSGVKLHLFKAIDRAMGYLSSYNLVDGSPQKKFLVQNNILNENKALVLGKGTVVGVNLENFQEDDSIRQDIRNRMGYGSETIVLLFLGRITEDKGIYDLLEAFDLVKKQAPNVVLVLAGPFEMTLVLKNNSGVVCAGFLRKDKGEVQEILQAADIFCFPSYREGFPVSVLEASAMGKPVICSDIYGIEDAFIDQVTGLKFRKGDVKDLGDKILSLINNKEKRISLGRSGSDYVRKNYDSKKVIGKYLRFYNQITKEEKTIVEEFVI